MDCDFGFWLTARAVNSEQAAIQIASALLPSPGGGGSPAQRAGRGDSLSPAEVFKWFNFCLARTVQLHINLFEYCRQIIRDLRIPESDDAISFMLKPTLSFAVALCGFIIIVMPAVEFDNEMLGRTEEIHDIGTDRCLTPEVRTVRRQLFQSSP